MSKVCQKRICHKYQAEKEKLYCMLCKTETTSHISVSVSEVITVRDSFTLRKFVSNAKKFLSEFKGGWFPSGDPKLRDGVSKSRTIDREKDEYHEVVKKYGTDEIIHENHEPLSNHRKNGAN